MRSLRLDDFNILVVTLLLCCLFLEKIIGSATFNVIYIPLMMYVFIQFSWEVLTKLSTLKATRLFVLLSILISLALVSSLVNDVSIQQTLKVVSYSMKYVILFYLLKNISREGAHRLEVMIIVLLLSEAILGIVQFLSPVINEKIIAITLSNTSDNFMFRMSTLGVSGTVGSKNVFALAMNIGIVIATKNYLESRKSIYVYVVIIFTLAILISASRFNMLLVSSLGVFLIKQKYGIIPAGLAVFSLFFSFFLILQEVDTPSSFTSLIELFSREYWQVSLELSRLSSWLISLEILKENPLFGIGAGNWGAGLAFNSNQYFSYYKNYFIITDVLQDNFWISEATQFGLLYLLVLIYLFKIIYSSLDHYFYNNYFIIVILLSSIIYPTIIMKVIGCLFWVYISLAKRSMKTNQIELSWNK